MFGFFLRDVVSGYQKLVVWSWGQGLVFLIQKKVWSVEQVPFVSI